MAMLVLPLEPGAPAYDLEVELSGKLYTLRLAFNARLGAWALDVLDAAGALLVAGVRVVADWGLLDQFVDERLPPGQLLCTDMSGAGKDPGEDDLGDRVILVYDDGQ